MGCSVLQVSVEITADAIGGDGSDDAAEDQEDCEGQRGRHARQLPPDRPAL